MGPRHIVITGGASGLGFGCASRFIDRGDRVTIGDVNHGAAEEAVRRLQARAPQAMARCEPLDLADPFSVDAFASTLKARGEPVDVLVNNAGIYPPSRRTLSREGHELTFAIAYLGHFRLTHALWPLLKAAPAPRVVTVSSLTQRSAQLHLDDLALASNYQPIRAYAQAKLSCLLFAYELHRRQAGSSSPVASVAAHPGVVRTQIARNRRVS